MRTIDLNCDLGEDPAMLGRDIALLDIVTSANIACGGHAGDEAPMDALVAEALARGCAVGAHPSYPDRDAFGRAEMAISDAELESTVFDQLSTLARIAAGCSVRLAHVKPHGALYHAAMGRANIAASIARAVERLDPSLLLVVQALPPASIDHATPTYAAHGLRVIHEAFADRRYEPDGQLRARSLPGAVIEDPHETASQAFAIAHLNCIPTTDGGVLSIAAGTICIHSDTPGSLATARAVFDILRKAGITPAPPPTNNHP